jgi:hypothetical protein
LKILTLANSNSNKAQPSKLSAALVIEPSQLSAALVVEPSQLSAALVIEPSQNCQKMIQIFCVLFCCHIFDGKAKILQKFLQK